MPRIAVAGPNQLVTDAAGLIADIGGSVVDTAIVAALAAMCSEPGICAPGGGGFLTINLPGADAVVIDGYMSYPGLGFSGEANLREITMDYGGGVTSLVDAGRSPCQVCLPALIWHGGCLEPLRGKSSWGRLLRP